MLLAAADHSFVPIARTVLMGLLLNAVFGWWWADPATALVLVQLVIEERIGALERGRANALIVDATSHPDPPPSGG